MRANRTLLELLLELQALDRVPRTGYLLRGVSASETVSEHVFHVAFLVWALGPGTPGLDLHRAVELALLHDLAEVRLGDLPRAASEYLPPGAKRAAEERAFADLLAPLVERSRPLTEEYLAGRSTEARFVRACDRLQLLLKVTAYEERGELGLEEFWQQRDDEAIASFDNLRALLDELLARRRRGRPTA